MPHHMDRDQSPTGTWDCTESRTVSNEIYKDVQFITLFHLYNLCIIYMDDGIFHL
jgi:hypothetical protein